MDAELEGRDESSGYQSLADDAAYKMAPQLMIEAAAAEVVVVRVVDVIRRKTKMSKKRKMMSIRMRM